MERVSANISNNERIKSPERSLDPHIVALVQLLARKAAEQDYQALLDKYSTEKKTKDKKLGND